MVGTMTMGPGIGSMAVIIATTTIATEMAASPGSATAMTTACIVAGPGTKIVDANITSAGKPIADMIAATMKATDTDTTTTNRNQK